MMDMMNTHTLRIPSYVRQFQCQQCGECCLAKWRIEIDQLTYDKVCKKYAEAGRQAEFEPMMKKDDQGRVIMNFDKGRCVALTDNNLCKYQKEFGHEYLSNTCKVYPRHIHVSSRGIEFSMTFSCKATTSTLRGKEKIVIEEVAVDSTDFFYMPPSQTLYYLPEKLPEGDWKRHYYLIENGLIAIMQDRDFSIGDRLTFVGRVLAQITALQADQMTAAKIEELLRGYRSLGIVNQDYGLHLGVLQRILNTRLQESKALRNAIGSMYKALALRQDDMDRAVLLAKVEPEQVNVPPGEYVDKVQRYLVAVRDEVEHIFEHYFVNAILKKEFYFHDWQDSFFKMALAHGILKLFTAGYCSILRKPADADIVLRVISEFDNSFSHSDAYLQKLREELKKRPEDERMRILLSLAKA